MKKLNPIYKFAVLSAPIAGDQRTVERRASKTCLLEVASEEFVEACATPRTLLLSIGLASGSVAC